MRYPLKSSLSPARRSLVELLQAVNFGRIENLAIRDAEPLFDATTHVIREIRFGADNSARPERHSVDFQLKSQVLDLFAEFDQIKNGVIECLVIKHGLPFSMSVKAAA